MKKRNVKFKNINKKMQQKENETSQNNRVPNLKCLATQLQFNRCRVCHEEDFSPFNPYYHQTKRLNIDPVKHQNMDKSP